MIDKQKAIEALETYKSNFTSYHSTIVASCIDIIRRLPDDDKCIALPCKVGDRVFSGNGNPLNICVSQTNGDYITQVKISRRGYGFKCWWGWFHISDIGKTVFLTREEAEAALEAQKGGEVNA